MELFTIQLQKRCACRGRAGMPRILEKVDPTPNVSGAARDDAKVRQQNQGDGLWSRDTSLGNSGCLGDYAHDERVSTSHTILTTDGILGRDLISR